MQAIASSRNIKSKRKSAHKRAFDAQAFLDSAGVARRVVEYRRSQKIYSQGDRATSVIYIQKGGVKLSVVNETGKEAVVAILGQGDFWGRVPYGPAHLHGDGDHDCTYTVLFIEKNEMIRVLHEEHEFSDRFIAYMLARNARVEGPDGPALQLQREAAGAHSAAARTLRRARPSSKVLPKVSQEMLRR